MSVTGTCFLPLTSKRECKREVKYDSWLLIITTLLSQWSFLHSQAHCLQDMKRVCFAVKIIILKAPAHVTEETPFGTRGILSSCNTVSTRKRYGDTSALNHFLGRTIFHVNSVFERFRTYLYKDLNLYIWATFKREATLSSATGCFHAPD